MILVLELIAGFTLVAPVQAATGLTRTPSCGPPGTTVTLGGYGFTPGLTVTISFDGVAVTSATADGSGAFAGVSFDVPDPGLVSNHTIMATDGANYALNIPDSQG